MNKNALKKILIIGFFILCSITLEMNFWVIKAYASTPYGINLVNNGNAEGGSLSGWTEDNPGGFTKYSCAANGFNVSQNGGDDFDYWTGAAGNDALHQIISISSISTDINAGRAKFNLRGEVCKVFERSTAKIKAEFFDASNNSLGTQELASDAADAPYISPLYLPNWQAKSISNGDIPINTDHVEISLIAIVADGSGADSDAIDFDGIYFSVEDVTAPTVGNEGTITPSNPTTSTVDLSWTAGSDNVTAPANLQYKVVRSTSNNIDTAVNAEANGTLVQDWSANITGKQATGLSASTTYYFNVIVKDAAGNKSVYSTATQATTAPVTAVTASSNGIATSTGTTTITLGQAITGLIAGDIVVKKGGSTLVLGTEYT